MYTLIDGVERNRRHPDSFNIPEEQDRQAVDVGDYIKIGAENCSNDRGERFWVEVVAVTPYGYVGRVDNDLVMEEDHGLQLNAIVPFDTEHMLSIIPSRWQMRKGTPLPEVERKG